MAPPEARKQHRNEPALEVENPVRHLTHARGGQVLLRPELCEHLLKLRPRRWGVERAHTTRARARAHRPDDFGRVLRFSVYV